MPTNLRRELRFVLLMAAAFDWFTPPTAKADDSVNLSVSVSSSPAEPGGRIQYLFSFRNSSSAAAQGVVFRFQLPEGFGFVEADIQDPARCSEREGMVLCSVDRLDGFGFLRGTVDAIAPASPRGGGFSSEASIHSDTPESDPSDNTVQVVSIVNRHYPVTSVDDSGPGSLRQAVEDANVECDRDGLACRIDFAIPPPVPERGWFTLRPRTPLPPITVSNLAIDGATQTATTGDTNPLGPEIELNGELCQAGNGLELRSGGEILVADLTVNGFPENGVLLTGTYSNLGAGRALRGNYIGTDPTGTRAVPNGLRGVACWGDGGLEIVGNVLSGNRRSGVFVASGARFSIKGNRIGTKARDDEPLPNGGSGIYFGNDAQCAQVIDNVIAYNEEFGVAAERYRQVVITRNSIKANGLLGITFGLDGPTRNDGTRSAGVIDPPVLASARYDPGTGLTVITGNAQAADVSSYVDFYGNTGSRAEGQIWLGQATFVFGGEFVFAYRGNLLGRFITATLTRAGYLAAIAPGPLGQRPAERTLVPCEPAYFAQTSEFSGAIPVTHSAASDAAAIQTQEPRPAPDGAAAATHASNAVDLRVSLEPYPEQGYPGGSIQFRFAIENKSSSPARNVVLRFQLPAGFTAGHADFGLFGFDPPTASCRTQDGLVTCTVHRLDAGKSVHPFVEAGAPSSARGGRFALEASVTSDNPDLDASHNTARAVLRVLRIYTVTNVLDAGPGSLREAIGDANLECDRDGVPCAIHFSIPPPLPEKGSFTVQLLSPLPPIAVTDFTLDAETELQMLGGGTVRPVVELNGGLCASGNGLEIRSAGDLLVQGLVLNGFPENGLLVAPGVTRRGSSRSIRGNYIGTDSAGKAAVPNGLRGITSLSGPLTVSFNMISSNKRSGLFFASGTEIAIFRNGIGVQAGGFFGPSEDPLPNGGSGIYFGAEVGSVSVTDNVVANNGEIGVALEVSARAVWIARNTIKGNGGLGIDMGLDGETPNEPNQCEIVSHPVLTEARYDEVTGTAIIRGRFVEDLACDGAGNVLAEVYVNDGVDPKAAEYLIGDVFRGSTDQFELIARGNFLGRHILATATRVTVIPESLPPEEGGQPALLRKTSEFSRPIPVTR